MGKERTLIFLKPSHCEAFGEAKAVAICLIYLGDRFREIASLFTFLNLHYTTGRLALTGFIDLRNKYYNKLHEIPPLKEVPG